MPSSKIDFAAFTVAQLEAFAIARGQVIEGIQREMVEIQQVIAAKNKHYMDVERFEGWTVDQIRAFHSKAQGVSLAAAKPFGE